MVRRLTTDAILVALSLTMFLIEGLIAMPILPPGAKLGLSNIVIVIALYYLTCADSLMILISRILLSSIFVGSPSVILFSFVGGVLSLIAMIMLKRSKMFSIFAVSAGGGFFHNFGQILVAYFLMDSLKIINYLTVLGICGVLTGLIIGFISERVLKIITQQLC